MTRFAAWCRDLLVRLGEALEDTAALDREGVHGWVDPRKTAAADSSTDSWARVYFRHRAAETARARRALEPAWNTMFQDLIRHLPRTATPFRVAKVKRNDGLTYIHITPIHEAHR